MRLVCPNCSAQYEIDGSMIPEDGRDVQCSNCGHTWFELPGPSEAETGVPANAAFSDEPEVEDEFDAPPAYDLDDDDTFEDDDDTLATSRRESVPDFLTREDFEDDADKGSAFSDWDDEPETPKVEPEDTDTEEDQTSSAVRAVTDAAEGGADAEDDAAVETATEEDTADDADESFSSQAPDDAEEDDTDAAGIALAAAAGTPRRPADAAALDILREEAERELSQRRAPPSDTLETQSDLGLEDIRDRRTPSRALRARMAHLGEELPEDDSPVDFSEQAPAPTPRSAPEDDDGYEEPRRDLLPDIDEINSTLKSGARGAEQAEVVKRSGFRFGFLTILFLTVAAIFAYAQAPAIARALPQTESTMISYVDWANGLRDWVDGLIGN